MRPALTLIGRRLLQAEVDTVDGGGGDDAILTHRNVSSAAVREPFTTTTPFDTSMALTILIILTALFFMGFFSVYIRRFSGDSSTPSGAASSSSANSRQAPSKGGGGLDPSAVSLLPLVAYDRAATAKHPVTEDCPICLSEFLVGERVKQIPYCGHVFHPSCVDTWLASHVTCPLCRSAKLFEEA